MTNHYYIHIPFCRQRCPYCKFALTPVFDEFKKRRYIEYLKREIYTYFGWWEAVNSVGFGGRNCLSQIKNSTKIAKWASFSPPNAFDTFGTKSMENGVWGKNQKTIYFGGWTPSVLSHDETREILECFPFYRESVIEITMEMNPEDITSEYIEWVLTLGINRISLWIQTLNETSLGEIHRSDRETILSALSSIWSWIKQSESDISLNVDFILGLPFVKPWETLAWIKELHSKFPYITHTSVYMLEDEKYPKHWKENSITEDEMQSEFLAIMEYLDSLWWHHYELSNWARPGYESVHNQAYWDHSNSRGFGLSAASYEDGMRWNNSSSFSGYYGWKRDNEEKLTPEQIQLEEMMFGLRRDGWDNNKTSIKTDMLIADWLIAIDENKIKPTKTWIFVIDHILSELISDS